MSQSLARPWTLDEFLAWEREQPERWEFDGVQPVPRGMVGGTRPHARLSARLLVALTGRVAPPCEAFGPDLKVIARGRVRYPDAMVECGRDDDGDVATPAVVFEVLSPTSERTARGTKAQDYMAEPHIPAVVPVATPILNVSMSERLTSHAFNWPSRGLMCASIRDGRWKPCPPSSACLCGRAPSHLAVSPHLERVQPVWIRAADSRGSSARRREGRASGVAACARWGTPPKVHERFR